MMVQTKAKRINLSRTHRISAPEPCIGTSLICLGFSNTRALALAGSLAAQFISRRMLLCSTRQKTCCGHTCAVWDKAPKQSRRRLGQSCRVPLWSAPQAWTIKPIYSRSVCDQVGLVRGSSASFQDLALVTAGTPKALSRTTQRKQARPAANPRSAAKQKMTSTHPNDTFLNELKQIASEVINKDVSVDAPLMDAGLDSISATELSNKISAHLNAELSPTLLFDHPSLRSIADALSVNSGSSPTQGPEPE